MQLIGGPTPEPSSSGLEFDSEFAFWEAQIEVDDRHRAFTHRLLRDFHKRWGHLFRNDYNLMTTRHLARAILRLAALDFEAHENTGGRQGQRRPLVLITSLPPWEPCGLDPHRVGRVWVVVCQRMSEGLAIVRGHSNRLSSGTTDAAARPDHSEVLYMITSVKYIMLCRSTKRLLLQYTAPVSLFNGDYNTHPAPEIAAAAYGALLRLAGAPPGACSTAASK
jgi:hypothetical protein